MIQSTPNSNLLTVADSPFQHHLVSLIIYLYIHRYIQMVLDASTTKEESLAYNPQGGRIVLHTACDKEVATFAFGQEAQWRNGKDNRPHLYVEGNPVGFRDPSGNALSNSWMYAIGTYVIAKSQGMNDQQAMIYAASAYGVGRAKDRNKGDFWKHNDISRGITSAWSSYLRSDFGRAYKSLGRQLSDYIKNPIRSLERSDLARSDIGKGYSRLMEWTRSMGDQYIHYTKYPKYALENSDLARSDYGRHVTSMTQQLRHLFEHPAYAIENSDLAKSPTGQYGTKLWRETSEARDLAGFSDFKSGGLIFSNLAKITGVAFFATVGKILGVALALNFIYESCSGKNGVYCDVSGR